MDDLFYIDTVKPFNAVDQATVTLAATNKALVPASALPALPLNYFQNVGKKARLEIFGKITTGITPGNLTLALLAGSGADANGTSLVASAAQTLIASQTDIPFRAVFNIHCRSFSSQGPNQSTLGLFVSGWAQFGVAVVAAGTILLPASAPAVVSGIIQTTPIVLSPQALRSGSTGETITIQDINFFALN